MGHFKKLIRRIDEIEKSLQKRYDGYYLIPLDIFYEKTRRALSLLDLVEKSRVSRDLKLEARKNFIINCITALEVFLKDMVLVIIDMQTENNHRANGIKLLLKEKITLEEAYKLFYKKDVSIGIIIISKYSFHNLETIDQILSVITKENFLEKLGKFKVRDDKEKIKFILDKKYSNKNWRNILAEFLNLRHQYVHQINFKDRLGLKRLKILYECLVDFVEATEQYLFEHIPINNNRISKK